MNMNSERYARENMATCMSDPYGGMDVMITTNSEIMPTYDAQGVTGSMAERRPLGAGPRVTYTTTCQPAMATGYLPHAPPVAPGGQERPGKSFYHPIKTQVNEKMNGTLNKDACMMGIRSKIKENMNINVFHLVCEDVFHLVGA